MQEKQMRLIHTAELLNPEDFLAGLAAFAEAKNSARHPSFATQANRIYGGFFDACLVPQVNVYECLKRRFLSLGSPAR